MKMKIRRGLTLSGLLTSWSLETEFVGRNKKCYCRENHTKKKTNPGHDFGKFPYS